MDQALSKIVDENGAEQYKYCDQPILKIRENQMTFTMINTTSCPIEKYMQAVNSIQSHAIVQIVQQNLIIATKCGAYRFYDGFMINMENHLPMGIIEPFINKSVSGKPGKPRKGEYIVKPKDKTLKKAAADKPPKASKKVNADKPVKEKRTSKKKIDLRTLKYIITSAVNDIVNQETAIENIQVNPAAIPKVINNAPNVMTMGSIDTSPNTVPDNFHDRENSMDKILSRSKVRLRMPTLKR